MNEQIDVGDIVISKSHNLKGKVVKVRHYDKSVLVEVIINYDPEERTRTTKLYSFALSDVKLYKFDNKKNKRNQVEPVEQNETENNNVTENGTLVEKANELFVNVPKGILNKDVLKNLEETMKLNRFVKVPEVSIPELKKGD